MLKARAYIMPLRGSYVTRQLGVRSIAKGASRDRQLYKTEPHTPVLLKEVIKYFKHTNLKVFVDCTVGAGGHSSAIIEEHPFRMYIKEMEIFIGIDMDPMALMLAQNNIFTVAHNNLKLHLLRGNFCDMKELILNKIEDPEKIINSGVDGILMDIGMSSMQVDSSERGFSFYGKGALDMRMDPNGSLTAKEIVNTYSEEEIGAIIRDFGEEKRWRDIACRICVAREEGPIQTTANLVKIIGNNRPPHPKSIEEKGTKHFSIRKSRIHPATKTFQALRIVVNRELENLEKVIPVAINMLSSKGRLGIISFHSLEDRIVKHAFAEAAGKLTRPISKLVKKFDFKKIERDAMIEGDEMELKAKVRVLTKSPVKPGEEVENNKRSRSAKLRFVEKL